MKRQYVSREGLGRLAAQWHNPGRSGYTCCLPPGQVPPNVAALPEDIVAVMKESETGAILFWSLADAHLVLLPFPVEAAATYQGWHAGPLQSLLERSRLILVLLLRLGHYAIGVFERDRLVLSKTGTRFVKGRHRKGGSSSARFARRREEQARALFDKTCQIMSELVEAYPGRLHHFLLGGDRLTLLAFEKRCAYLQRLSDIRLHRILNLGDPSLNALKSLPRQIYMSCVITFSPETTNCTTHV